MEFSSGFGRQDITCFIPGLGMMGYGQPHNIMKEIATPLMARAMYLKHQDGSLVIFIHLEMAFVSMAVKARILELLQERFPVTHANLIITASHTHSGPGGFSHYPFYNFTVPHFRNKVVETIATGACHAVDEAYKSLAPCTLTYGEIEIDEKKEVAFNRSLTAHQNNPEAQAVKLREEAVDRKMRGLLVKSEDGKLKAIINWFGVHCTSVSSYNQRIHHDNKGVAAALFEKNHPGTYAFFLQSAAGDVSPNFFWDKKINRMRGKFYDQYDSAAFNGELQFREAEKIKGDVDIKGSIHCLHSFFDMTTVTSSPAHGVAFFKGTLEGPGMPPQLAPVLSVLARFVRAIRLFKDPEKHRAFYAEQDPKHVMLDHRDGSFLGIPVNFFKKIPAIPDPILEAFQKTAKSNALETLPWVPTILPFQIIRLGQILIVTIPGEITTMAARRLEIQIKSKIDTTGISEVIITSYANGYMGYVTTPEEYDLQSYEAGHCIFGRNSLAGMFTAIYELVSELKGETHIKKSTLSSFAFPTEELARRSF